jgi:prepilin-type N-terminal cleavage/methylation domain-containing protein
MDSHVLVREKGFSLIELVLVLMLASVFIAAVSHSALKIRQLAKAQRTLSELEVIASVSIQYYLENGAWPATLADLRPKYLSANSSGLNPFGNAYTIAGATSSVSVSTFLPKGLITEKSFGSELVVVNQGANDLVSLSKSVESRNWKLKYEKKYIYQE